MTRLAIKEHAEAVRARYLRSSKKERGEVLDEFVAVVGCHRKSAVRLLGLRIGSSAIEGSGFTTGG